MDGFLVAPLPAAGCTTDPWCHIRGNTATLDGAAPSGVVRLTAATVSETDRAKAAAPRLVGMLVAGRTEYFETMFHEFRYHLVGLQEARSPLSGMRSGRNYHMIKSASDNGSYGVELWASAKLPYATIDGRPRCFGAKDFTVLSSDARFLLVRIEAQYVAMDVVVLHSVIEPSSVDDQLAAKHFWERVRARIQTRPAPQLPLLLLTDAN